MNGNDVQPAAACSDERLDRAEVERAERRGLNGLDVRQGNAEPSGELRLADAKALARDLGADEIALCTLKDAVKLLPLWPREAAAIGYVSQAVIVEENGGAIDALLELVVHARLRQH